MKRIIYNGDIIEKDGLRFRVNIEDDHDLTPPWQNSDGHGVVTDWTSRDKKPGELILNTDHGSKRFYDVPQSLAIAMKDGWGLNPEKRAELAKKLNREPTAKEIARAAVDANYEYLRRYCNDQWGYVGVIVTQVNSQNLPSKPDYSNAVWGIESDAYDSIAETAEELIDNLLREKAEQAKMENWEHDEVAFWASRDIITTGEYPSPYL